jgi:hypothetical protein
VAEKAPKTYGSPVSSSAINNRQPARMQGLGGRIFIATLTLHDENPALETVLKRQPLCEAEAGNYSASQHRRLILLFPVGETDMTTSTFLPQHLQI